MKISIYLGVLGVCALPLASCSDFLDAENKTSANLDGNIYLSEDPSQLRATAYEALRANIVNIDMQDLATDLFTCPRSGDDGPYAQFSITADNDDIKKFYTNASKAINYANGMIHFAGADSELGQEGRFLRAYSYYYMTQQFGAVPYLTDYIESSTRDYPRTDLKTIYDACIDDLTDLYNNSALPATDNTTGGVSKQAVAALLSRIALAAGWDLGTTLNDAARGTYTVNSTDYFNLAAQWAETAINGVQLTMPFEDKWSPFNESNNEVIWSIQWKREGFPGDVSTGGHSLQNNYKADYVSPNLSGQKGDKSGGRNVTSEKALLLWDKGDTRFAGTFMTTMYNAPLENGVAMWGTHGYYAYYNCSADELARMPIAAHFFPYYTTQEEAQAWLVAHNKQTVKFPVKTYGWDTPFAIVLDPLGVTRYTFNADGSYEESTQAYNQYAAGGQSFNGIAVKKFDDPESIQSSSDNDYRNVVAFHVSEMYLVAAEAYYMAGNETEALKKINDVRRRAGAKVLGSLSDYASSVEYTSLSNAGNFGNITFLDLILDECAREMYAERTRYYDLRRTKQLVRYNIAFSRNVRTVQQMSNAAGEIKWYRPIPQAEINANTSMSQEDQNPGY